MNQRSLKTVFCLPQFQKAVVRAAVFCVASCLTVVLIAGCASKKATVRDLNYCDDITGINHYRDQNNSIAYACLDKPTVDAVAVSHTPRNLRRHVDDTPREITLTEALHTAMTQNQVLETSALGGIGAKGVLTNPAGVATVFDPAIQSSGVLFGRRSVESALADFDTTFTSSMVWQRSDLNAGGSLAGGGNRADFTSGLRKQFANGSSVSLNHDVAYSGDVPDYNGNKIDFYGSLGANFRQPLLAGSGVDYTRIAGPANPNFGSITGVSQGVVIARINQDISIADFEIAVRNAMQDIEDAYWDLYLTYRTYDTAVVAHQSAFQTWREAQDRLEVGVLKPADELQALDQLYETKAAVETTLNALYKAESELRRLIGIPINDGTVLIPIDDPIMAEFIPDWTASLTEGLTQRVELRRQKWTVKSLQLQLQAAKSLVRPRLDLIAGYDVQGAGKTLLNQSRSPFQGVYGSMNNDNINSWNLGVEVSVPLGFRFTRSQVRNLELQISKATAILSSQEKNIAHDIATAIQDVTASYSAAQSNYKRLAAAARRVTLLEAEREIGTTTLDLVLRAQRSLAAAESSYYREVVNYNKAITALDLATGALLENNGIYLAEGRWQPAAYCDAEMRAHARTHAKDAPHLMTQPAEFVSPRPTGTVNLRPADRSNGIDPVLYKPTAPATEILPPVPGSESALPAPTNEPPLPVPGKEPVPPVPGSEPALSQQIRASRDIDPEQLEIMPPELRTGRRSSIRSTALSEDFPSFSTTAHSVR